MAVDPARVKSLFLAAADLADPAERAAYLNRECGEEAELRARVEALLRVNDASPLPESEPAEATGDYAQDASDAGASNHHHGESEQAGTIIAGKYTLVELIGEGGMGSVWRAKQTEPVKRFVAVKLIKAGMDSKQVLARFDAERQALALMDHPNIAKVLDGGVHEHRPFFVMELVKGVPITDFCDARKLTPKGRLELFVPVCQAIQHAHQKGIIHRDIKPSNVLIALYDDKAMVKVIDFGVAKATGGTLTEQTIETGFGGVVGTPQYMSPEQATFNNLDIDTRSDVYALGVLLYELLTGSPPFSKKDLEKKGLVEILRVVREEEPPRPSMKLSADDALPTLSANRGTEPKKLMGLLRNELDWIVMKALEKERARRYETANGFAADVLRYLGGETVQAHPPSTAYRLKKFVKRYKGQVFAANVVFFALVAGIGGTTLGLLEARHQEGLALGAAQEERQAKLREAERAEGEKAAKLQAQKNLQQANENLAFAKKGNDILGSVFTGLDPKKNYVTVGELSQALKDNLKKAVQELEGSAIGDALTVARMQITLGLSLLGLGEPSQAIILFERVRATMAAKLGPDHPDTLTSMNNLAAGYQAAGRLDQALPLYEETLKLQRAKLGPDHPDTLLSMNNLALGYHAAGQFDRALPLWEQTLKLRRAKLGPYHPETLVSMYNLGSGYKEAGRVQEALPQLEEAFHTAKINPISRRNVGSQLLDGYDKAGKTAEAAKLVTELLADARKQLPKDSPELAEMLVRFGLSRLQANAFTDAEALLRESLTIREKTMPDAWTTFNTMSMLGGALLGQKKYAAAGPLLLKGYEGMKQREKTIPPQRIIRISEALDRLIALSTATNKPEQAKKWRAERATYPQAKKPVAPEKK